MRKKSIGIRQVAEEAGVSIATVSRVINQTGYVSPDAEEAVREAIGHLGYSVPAKKPLGANNKLIGVILKKLPTNMFFESLHYHIQRQAENRGLLTLPLYCDHIKNETLRDQVQRLMDCQIHGLIIAGFEDNTVEPEIKAFLQACSIPFVFVERVVDTQGFNQIFIDNRLGGYISAQHLIRQGHKKILYIGRQYIENNTGSERRHGFLQAMQEADPAPEYLLKNCDSPSPDDAYQATAEAFRELPGITGIQTWYDGFLIGVMRYLYERGLRVPEDVEVIGHDNTYSALTAPPVSSVQLPFGDMAYAAIRIICNWYEDQDKAFVQSIRLEPKLVLR